MNISHIRKWKEKFITKEPVIFYHFHLRIKPKNKEMTVLKCTKHLFSNKRKILLLQFETYKYRTMRFMYFEFYK